MLTCTIGLTLGVRVSGLSACMMSPLCGRGFRGSFLLNVRLGRFNGVLVSGILSVHRIHCCCYRSSGAGVRGIRSNDSV